MVLLFFNHGLRLLNNLLIRILVSGFGGAINYEQIVLRNIG